MGQRFQDEHRALANVIGRLFLQAATGRSEGGERIIPNRRTTRDALVATIYAQVLKPYYVGSGEEPLAGTRPLSPYARLVYDGVRGMVQIEAEAQAALVRRLVSDEVVVDWLLSPYTPRRPVQEMSVSSFTQWLDPRGFRLTERIQRVAVEVRSRVARFVDYHIGQGTPAPTMATQVEAFLTTGAPKGHPGNTTYGQQGAVAPRVLVRHEMVKAGGDAVAAESEINPYVRGAQWLLDPAHPRVDHCDVNATGGEDGDGVYPLSELPAYPDHIGCLCHLRAVPVRNLAAVTATIRQAIEERTPAAEALRGALNPERVTTEVMTGAIQQTADQVQAAPLSMPKAPVAEPQPSPATASTPVAPATGQQAPLANIPEKQRRKVARYQAQAIREAAAQFGVSESDVRRVVTETMTDLADPRNPIAINLPSEVLDKILESGRFKSQFETKTSEVIVATRQRATAEQRGLGYPKETPAEQRPIYSYVADPRLMRGGASYGDLRFEFKNEIRDRTTIVLGDSLEQMHSGWAVATPIAQPGAETWGEWANVVYGAATGRYRWDDVGLQYLEAQIHGQAKLADVARVYDTTDALTLTQIGQLQRLGITVFNSLGEAIR